MKRVISIQTIEGELIDYKNNITFKIPNPEFESVWSKKSNGIILRLGDIPGGSINKLVDRETCIFDNKCVYMIDTGNRIIKFS